MMSEQLDKAFEALKTYEWGVDPTVLKPIDEAILATRTDAAARKDLETRLSAVLATDAPRAAKDAVCRALKIVGTAASVPALAPLLPNEELSHMARYALERIPAPPAGQALLAALPAVGGKLKVGILSSLGARREAAAAAPLQDLLDNTDPAIAKAAAHALGAIGSLTAGKALVIAKTNAVTKPAIADASLVCAGHLATSGNKAAAKAIYEKLLASEPSAPVLQGATTGMQAL